MCTDIDICDKVIWPALAHGERTSDREACHVAWAHHCKYWGEQVYMCVAMKSTWQSVQFPKNWSHLHHLAKSITHAAQ